MEKIVENKKQKWQVTEKPENQNISICCHCNELDLIVLVVFNNQVWVTGS